MKKIVSNIMKYLISFFFSITSCILLYYVNKLNILKPIYYTLLCMIVVFLWLIINYKIYSSKTRIIPKIIFILLSIVLSISYSYFINYASNTVDFLKKITKKEEYKIQKYSVFVLNNSNINEINDLEGSNLGFISSNLNIDKVISKLNKSINYNNLNYENIGTLVYGMYNNEIKAIVLEDSYIQLIQESNLTFLEESKIIYSFEIKIKKDARQTKKIDINYEPFIVYISGSDSRGTIYDVSRSDVNILAVINPQNNKILLLTIPRDYYVQLHGTTGAKDKLTDAGLYGIDMSKSTIEDLLDIEINYYVKVSFNTLVNLVDVLDGIDIYSDTAFEGFTQDRTKCIYKVGIQHLNGKCTLRFVRERKKLSGGDRHRGTNQQQVITKIIEKLKQPKYLVNYNNILKSMDGTFETDITYDEITNFIKYQLTNLTNWQIKSISVDGTDIMSETYTFGKQKLSVMVPDEKTIEIAKEKIKEYLEK